MTINVRRENLAGVKVERIEGGSNGDLQMVIQSNPLEVEVWDTEGGLRQSTVQGYVKIRIDQEAALLLIEQLAAKVGGRPYETKGLRDEG